MSTEKLAVSDYTPATSLAPASPLGAALPTLNLDGLKKPTVPFGTKIKTKLRPAAFLKANKVTSLKRNDHNASGPTQSNYISSEGHITDHQSNSQGFVVKKNQYKSYQVNSRRESMRNFQAIHVEQHEIDTEKMPIEEPPGPKQTANEVKKPGIDTERATSSNFVFDKKLN